MPRSFQRLLPSPTVRLISVVVMVMSIMAPLLLPGQNPQNLNISSAKLGDIPEPVNDPKAIEIINRYIQALGGQELLDAIEDKVVTFETVKHAPTGETTAKLKLYLKEGYKIREEWDLPGFTISDQQLQFVQVYNGFDGWVQMFGTVSPLEGRTLSIFVWDKPIDDFFCHWKEDGYSVKYVNESTIKDEPVDVIETNDFHGKNKIRYFFSKTSGLLLKKEWRDQDQKGAILKSNYYMRYRDIPFKSDAGKKVKVALHQQIYIRKATSSANPGNENLDTERIYTEVTFNQNLKDAIFERPEGEEFTGGIGRGARPSGINPAEAFRRYQEAQKAKKAGGSQTKKPTPVKAPTPVKIPSTKKGPPQGDSKN